MAKKKSAYAQAGVDIDIMMNSLKRIKRDVKSTATSGVVSEIGSFGGLFQSPGKEMLLVASADGVGTKLNVAHMVDKHNTVGQCLINHCTNDILVQGATPLFFLDYLGAAALEPKVFEAVVAGLSKACRENECALLGGETAEMPGLYPRGEYDLVGTIVGQVEKKKVITGESIRKGDVLIGLPSTGLHTNGYSLARTVIFQKAKKKLSDLVPGTNTPFGEALLAVHKSYLKPVAALMKTVKVHGMAHITGGGLVDNVPRILPDTVDAVFDRSSWKTPALFEFIEEAGNVDHEEMYRVFNMGVGMVLFVRSKDADAAMDLLKKQKARPKRIGRVETGEGKTRLIN